MTDLHGMIYGPAHDGVGSPRLFSTQATTHA